MLRVTLLLTFALLTAGVGGAVHPGAAPVVVATAAGIAFAVLDARPDRRVFLGGLLFVALITVPYGLLTHGAFTADGPIAPVPYVDTLDRLAAHDRVDFRDGTLVSYADTTRSHPVIAYLEDGRPVWAYAFPNTLGITAFSELRVHPVLWRQRVDVYVHGAGAPGWLYIWRTGTPQKLYVLDE